MGFVNWLTNKANPHYEQKQASTLLKWCVCVSELWRRTSKERREWQLVLLLVRPPDKIRVTGEHGTPQVPPSRTSTLLVASIWPLTSPSPTNMSIPFWFFSPFCLLKCEYWCLQNLFILKATFCHCFLAISAYHLKTICLSFTCDCPPSTKCHKPVGCVLTVTT